MRRPITEIGGRIRIYPADKTCITIKLPKFAVFRPCSIRKRLWQGGIALAVLIGTFAVGNCFISVDKSVSSRMLGHDFLAFYSAGTFARHGQFDRLYDLVAIRDMEHTAARDNNLETGSSFGPYWNPPFYALALAPFASMPYRSALATWTLLNLICLALAMMLLARMLPPAFAQPPHLAWSDEPTPLRFKRDWRNWALIPLLICTSMPFIQAISHGQNTFCSLLLLTLVITAWRARMPLAAGLVCGCLFYKPQLAAVIAAMLILSLGIRALIGLGIMACLFSAISVLAMPHSIDNYLVQLPGILRYMQIDHAYLWERHVTLKAFFRLLLQGRDAGETSGLVSVLTTVGCASIAYGLLVAWWRSRRPGVDDCWTGETRATAHDRLITATIASMPLLMPFYFDYDLLLLSVPAVLLAAEISAMPPGAPLDRLQRMLVKAWAALFCWSAFNPPIAAASGLNVSIVLLTTISGLSIARAIQHGIRTTTIKLPRPIEHVEVRRAA